MANIKITDLTAYTDAASIDVLPIVDVGANITKKISISDILKATPAGTAALPAIAIDGDPNTGIWSPAADTLAVSTGGYERLRITSGGLVGIGTTSPNSALHVNGDVRLLGASGPLVSGGGGSNIVFGDAASPLTGGTAYQNVAIGYLTLSSYSGTGYTNNTAVGQAALRYTTTGTGNTCLGMSAGTAISNGNNNTCLGIGAGSSITTGSNNVIIGNIGGTASLANTMIFGDGAGNERFRVDSSGRLLVGTSSTSSTVRLVVQGNSVDVNGPGSIRLARGSANPANGDALGYYNFTDSGHTPAAYIGAERDGGTWTSGSSQPTRLVFSTTADGASSPTERARITQAGYFKATSTGSYNSSTGTYYEFNGNAASGATFNLLNTNGSYAGALLNGGCDRAATTAYDFQNWYSAYSGTFDLEFRLRGDGTGLCDGSWTGGGADYAEYFEWSDGNIDEEDRRGISVVLDGNKIRPAVDGEDPIGVISGNPSVVGDAAWNKWTGKYLRDDYGSYILNEDGERQLNPAYDPDVEYINRENRPEWDCVGLMGKLRIRKGQPTGSRWIKMRDISDSVEEWLVR